MSKSQLSTSYTQKKVVRNPDPSIFEVESKCITEISSLEVSTCMTWRLELQLIKTKIVQDSKWNVRPFVSHVQQLKYLMAMGNINYGALVYEVIGGNEPLVQFNYRMDKGELEGQLKILEERAATFLNAKIKKDPALAKQVFFDKDLRWLCHRIDKQIGEHIWCPYYWKCMSIIAKERASDELSKPDSDQVVQNVSETE